MPLSPRRRKAIAETNAGRLTRAEVAESKENSHADSPISGPSTEGGLSGCVFNGCDFGHVDKSVDLLG
jgi:hypothetical protein